MPSRREARVLSVQALYSWDVTGTPRDELLQFRWRKEGWTPHALIFPALLVRGTLEEIETIDEAIARHLKGWSLERLQLVDRAILRVATYELLYRREVPATVVIDEAVEIAKEYGGEESYRFVNGVLDGIRKAASGVD